MICAARVVPRSWQYCHHYRYEETGNHKQHTKS